MTCHHLFQHLKLYYVLGLSTSLDQAKAGLCVDSIWLWGEKRFELFKHIHIITVFTPYYGLRHSSQALARMCCLRQREIHGVKVVWGQAAAVVSNHAVSVPRHQMHGLSIAFRWGPRVQRVAQRMAMCAGSRCYLEFSKRAEMAGSGTDVPYVLVPV